MSTKIKIKIGSNTYEIESSYVHPMSSIQLAIQEIIKAEINIQNNERIQN